MNTNCKMEEESGKNVQSIKYRLYVMHTRIKYYLESCYQCHNTYHMWTDLLLSSFTSSFPAIMSSFSIIMEEQSNKKNNTESAEQRRQRKTS